MVHTHINILKPRTVSSLKLNRIILPGKAREYLFFSEKGALIWDIFVTETKSPIQCIIGGPHSGLAGKKL